MADYQGIFSSDGGGGVQTIGAGTNILVDNTDPLNPIVSVTGVALASHTHDAAAIITGTIATARLGSGTANNTTFLRGDQTWATVSGGVAGFIGSQNTASPNNTVNASRLLVDAVSTNADAVIQPKGSGAFLAQLPDATGTGGNKRGTYAVDFQRERNAAAEIASGNYAVVVNGFRNTASGQYSVVVNGTINTASGNRAFVGGGDNNQATQSYTFIGGGNNNQTSNSYAVIAAGHNNIASNQYASVLGGYQNFAQGYASTSVGGYSNNASQMYTAIGGGTGNQNYGPYGTIAGGEQNTISHSHAAIVGGRYASTRNVGSVVFANHYNWTVGDAQFADNIYTARFTGAGTNTVTIMGGLSQGVYVPNSSAVTFNILVSARELFTNNVGGWIISGVAQTNGSTLILTHVTVNLLHRTVGTWDVTVIADTANQTINLRATQSAGNAIQWVGTGRFCYCTMNG